MNQNELYLIAHNVRSAHNVGSMLRSADAFGITDVYLTGYTPYPALAEDKRLPHLADRIDRRIKKTSLGAEAYQKWSHEPDIFVILNRLRQRGIKLVALEQTASAQPLATFSPSGKLAIIVGREVEGIEEPILNTVDVHIQIPMRGRKESLNVAVAAAVAMYQLTKDR